MGMSNKHGFTIIETMLFLAISGALTVAVLVGAGASISQQRYRDSVNSLSNFLQQQYSDVTSVRNDRDSAWSCNAVTGPVVDQTGGTSRGATECVVVGKYVSLSDKTVTVQTVIGKASVIGGTSDIDTLNNSELAVTDLDKQTYTVEWGAAMQKADKTPSATTMLIVRSPVTGSIRTFIDESGANQPIASMVDVARLRVPANICVDSSGMFDGKRFEILIIPNASSATGVKVNGDQTTTC